MATVTKPVVRVHFNHAGDNNRKRPAPTASKSESVRAFESSADAFDLADLRYRLVLHCRGSRSGNGTVTPAIKSVGQTNP